MKNKIILSAISLVVVIFCLIGSIKLTKNIEFLELVVNEHKERIEYYENYDFNQPSPDSRDEVDYAIENERFQIKKLKSDLFGLYSSILGGFASAILILTINGVVWYKVIKEKKAV